MFSAAMNHHDSWHVPAAGLGWTAQETPEDEPLDPISRGTMLMGLSSIPLLGIVLYRGFGHFDQPFSSVETRQRSKACRLSCKGCIQSTHFRESSENSPSPHIPRASGMCGEEEQASTWKGSCPLGPKSGSAFLLQLLHALRRSHHKEPSISTCNGQALLGAGSHASQADGPTNLATSKAMWSAMLLYRQLIPLRKGSTNHAASNQHQQLCCVQHKMDMPQL